MHSDIQRLVLQNHLPLFHPCAKTISTRTCYITLQTPKNLKIMSIVKVIEVIAGSEKSFDDATRNALKEASKSVKNIRSINIKNMNAKVKDNQIVSYGVTAKISFEVGSE
jgi:flavin-binding protein dodecin